MNSKEESSYIKDLKKTIDLLKEKIRKLTIKISNLEKLNSRLISDNKSSRRAWGQTEARLKKNVVNKSLKQIFKEIKEEQEK